MPLVLVGSNDQIEVKVVSVNFCFVPHHWVYSFFCSLIILDLKVIMRYLLALLVEISKVLFSTSVKILHFFKQARSLSSGLILKDSKSTSKKVAILSSKKITKKKPRKKRIIIKRVPDDIEAIWLENLSKGNLALFRKTSYGSFRKINLSNLFERLKEIYPSTLGNVNFVAEKEENIRAQSVSPAFIKPKTQSNFENVHASSRANVQSVSSSSTKSKTESESEDVQASPYLSEYLIKHIMDFPLLKSQSDKNLGEFFKDEIEEFGVVDSVTFPSVTGILNETMPDVVKFKLKQWKDRMIAELGLQGFYKYQRDLLTQGSKFHATLKTYLEVPDKSLVKIDPQIEGCWKSLETFFPDVSDVRFVEESIYHPFLMYKGIVDCVATFRGTPCVIEWKKSSKLRSSLSETYDAPIQLCAYLGALPWHKNLTVENGLVVVVYNDGTPANVFNLTLESCEFYWLEWLRRLQTYWLKKSSMIVQQEV